MGNNAKWDLIADVIIIHTIMNIFGEENCWKVFLSIVILFFVLVGAAAIIGSYYQNNIEYNLDNRFSETEVVDSAYPYGYWEKYSTDLRNKEIEAAASVKKGKGIWEERKTELKKEEEIKKQENIDSQVEQWRREAREKLNT